MQERADLFGRALLEWARGGTEPEFIERGDGLVVEGAGHAFYLAERPDWPAAERQAMRLVRGRALDIGCGAGRVALDLQRSGRDVVGLDISKRAIAAARLRGLEQARRVSADQVIDEVAGFDTLILFGNNFGVFGTPARLRRTLVAWARRVGDGTRILAESTNPYSGGAPAFDRALYQRNKARGQPPGHIRLRTQYRGVVGAWSDWLFVSRAEMAVLVRGTGWEVRRMLGDTPTEPFVGVLERV